MRLGLQKEIQLSPGQQQPKDQNFVDFHETKLIKKGEHYKCRFCKKTTIHQKNLKNCCNWECELNLSKIQGLMVPTKLLNSKIVTDAAKQVYFATNLPGKKFGILYRGSVNGFSAEHFHKLTNCKGPTITVILSDVGKVFGLYTDIPLGSFTEANVRGHGNSFKFALRDSGLLRFQVKPGHYELQMAKKHLLASCSFIIRDNCNLTSENIAIASGGYAFPPGVTNV